MEGFRNTQEENKQEVWERIAREIDSTVDGLGKPLEEKIKESVIGLKAHGFGTTASCEGHVDSGLPYPWIDVGSRLYEEHQRFGSRYRELWKEHVAAAQGKGEMSETAKGELQEIIEKEIAENREAMHRLAELLDEFHELESEDSSVLEMVGKPRASVRLRPSGVPVGSLDQLKETLSALTEEEIQHNLEIYQTDMKRFGQFLKNRFFNT